MHITIWEVALSEINIHFFQKAQIAILKQNKALIIIITAYSNFVNNFLKKKVWVVVEQINLNKQAIELKNDEQSLYKPTYSLSSIKLKTLKMYIKTHSKTECI